MWPSRSQCIQMGNHFCRSSTALLYMPVDTKDREVQAYGFLLSEYRHWQAFRQCFFAQRPDIKTNTETVSLNSGFWGTPDSSQTYKKLQCAKHGKTKGKHYASHPYKFIEYNSGILMDRWIVLSKNLFKQQVESTINDKRYPWPMAHRHLMSGSVRDDVVGGSPKLFLWSLWTYAFVNVCW